LRVLWFNLDEKLKILDGLFEFVLSFVAVGSSEKSFWVFRINVIEDVCGILDSVSLITKLMPGK
jgi:hypothetical protein